MGCGHDTGAPALTSLASRTGMRSGLLAYWAYDLVEIAAWLDGSTESGSVAAEVSANHLARDRLLRG